jgi:fucose permease
VDGDVATLTLIHDQDALFGILVLRLETGFELPKVHVANAQIPQFCGWLLHDV